MKFKTLFFVACCFLAISLFGCNGRMCGADANWRPQEWVQEKVVLEHGEQGSFDEVSVKDPTIVFYKGKWHVFYTARRKEQYGLGYVSAKTLEGLKTAKRHFLSQMRSVKSEYAAAPQVFYFKPQKTWYLIYQSSDKNLQPVYSTTKTIDDPESWTEPKILVDKDEQPKWIDFWVICDDQTAYLFYSRGRDNVYFKTTAIEDFPQGFSKGKLAFEPVPEPLSEAVHVYKVKGRREYHLFFEKKGEDTRLYGMAKAESLAGPWERVTDMYAAPSMLRYLEGEKKWTETVSHIEMLRSGYDQKLEYDPCNPKLLIQGVLKSGYSRSFGYKGGYDQINWKLGIISGR
ncbi:MAG: non-reducing end alpha-L-arabinofuranosidase family hydrolase [Planctomycetota bacterium]|jgi:hypothetical protein